MLGGRGVGVAVPARGIAWLAAGIADEVSPVWPPISAVMLASVMRSCIGSRLTASPVNSTACERPPSRPSLPQRNSMTSLATTPSPNFPRHSISIVSGTRSQISPVASTPAISVAPMPNM